ncbi:uncharacterized protein LOC115449357 isoform X2 [Manduca sexta]|uniref:uncharacterized protein LOC115449357 isoform X2 n=1 Tax=Manduca sexta TaxID=7130 RepID=UPI00118252E3|nr:uncharacterized protein LOC115449357 isoform X2 [Manduca sexta]
MSLGWGSLPLLPLRCVLDHLSTEDALAAMSTCHHWRSAVLLYEGRKETLKLITGSMERNMFLARIFRKHTRKLHIFIEHEAELDKFITFVLPQFFDSVKLSEIIFIGPSYVRSQHISVVKLKRILTETLVFKHANTLKKLAYLGCELDTGKNDHDRYTHKQIEYYSRPLSFSGVNSPADAVLSQNNIGIMAFSALKHIIVDYERIDTSTLETLSRLNNFRQLSLNIVYKKQLNLKPIDWHRLQKLYPRELDVAVNIIAMPFRKFNDVIENVLVEGLPLTSIKVMFCKSIYTALLGHVARRYPVSLRELVWADAPYDSADEGLRHVRPVRDLIEDTYNVNPFILLCWQCMHLQRLVIHGYWVWQYDLLGFVRLRKGLTQLEVSAVYSRQERFCGTPRRCEEGVVRVLAGDAPAPVDHQFLDQVSAYTERAWAPVAWRRLPAGLRARAAAPQRLHYALHEAAHPLGVT